MPHFMPVNTRRLGAKFKELTIGDAIRLAQLPPGAFELTASEFLDAVVADCDGVPDCLDWTVQERLLVTAQYMSACNGDAPDFEIGEHGHYSDYLAAEKDVELDGDGLLQTFPVGLIADDDWQIRYLTGRMAQSIERLRGEVKLPGGGELTGYAHWELGCMAAQLFLADDPEPPSVAGQYDEWLVHRMGAFLYYPQGAYGELRAAFYDAWWAMAHLFDIGLSNDGIVVLPREDKDGLPSARFRVHSLFAGAAESLA
ncbi:hypothetical protein KFZ76_06980 [Methylovulum psychrotolerans]|uniref:hypothetical protein n=1 Tax=Methylovulum psychrotolerans TaxID=1704499 RepID=UPI001BFF4D52|nr:hypothetical protein [Methylovulum psychrotolerans]MBT9097454.1 hypothetical protein [Methylovulum psychrotolerans]